MAVTVQTSGSPDENQSVGPPQVVELPASCSLPLFRDGGDKSTCRIAGLAHSDSPSTTAKNEKCEETMEQVRSIRIPLFQLNGTQGRMPPNNDPVTVSTSHFLAAWATLLACYADTEYPYFGYTALATAGEEHLLCHARVRQSESSEDILASVTVDSLHRYPRDQGGDSPIFNTRFIDSTGDLREHKWEEVNSVALQWRGRWSSYHLYFSLRG
jgi:hypothetical protein